MFELAGVNDISRLKSYIQTLISVPSDVVTNRLLTHLVWSDPDETITHWDENPTGQGYMYGTKVVEEFCNKYEITQIVRSSEMFQAGYQFFSCPKLLTIFSAPDYMETYGNDATMLYLFRQNRDQDIKAQLKVLQPILKLRCKQTFRMNFTLEEYNLELGVGE